MGATHAGTKEHVLVESLDLQRSNSFRNSRLTDAALSSHLIAESHTEQISTYTLTTRRPRVKTLRAASTPASINPQNAQKLIDQRNADAAKRYLEELTPGLDFAYGKMKDRREFTEAFKLQAESINYLNHSNIVEIRDADGRVVGTLRIIDAPFGAHTNLKSLKSDNLHLYLLTNARIAPENRPIEVGNFGPTVAARELSPNDYALYLHGIQMRSNEISGKDSYNGGLTVEMLKDHPLFGTPEMETHYDALGLYTDQHLGLENGRFTGAERMMMENLHRSELIAAGFANGLLPRIPYTVTYFRGKDEFIKFAGIAREVGMLAIEENLPLIEREFVAEVIFTKFLDLLFDPRETPYTNIMGQVFYTYGNGISKVMYKSFGFTEMGPKLQFNGNEADILHATPLQIIEAFLKKHKTRHPLMTDGFIQLLVELKNDIPTVAPIDELGNFLALRNQLQRVIDILGELDQDAQARGEL